MMIHQETTSRRAGRAITVVLVVAGALVAAGCTMGAGRTAGTTSTTAVLTESTTLTPVDPSVESLVELVGAWSSSGENTEIAYRFTADGRYRAAEILSQPRPNGVFELTVTSDGRARVNGALLILAPVAVTSTRTDPEHPEEDYTGRPMPITERTYEWRIDGVTLTLRDHKGTELHLMRQQR